jgi:hypothetical protein
MHVSFDLRGDIDLLIKNIVDKEINFFKEFSSIDELCYKKICFGLCIFAKTKFFY